MKKEPKICVVGSSNFDLIAYTHSLPKQGETILGNDFKMGFGGKGANQAVAAAKLGAQVTMVTKLGKDMFGSQTLENYKNQNINTDFISLTAEAPSGVAPIWVDKEGHNSIIVIPGANNLMTIEEIEQARTAIATADILICQNEIPLPITKKALEIARAEGITTVFNPAPAPKEMLTTEFLSLVDILCPNETETELLTNLSIKTVEDAFTAGKILLEKGVKKVIITLGAKGAVLVEQQSALHISNLSVKALDTTGAGDCFIGSFSYFYAAGLSMSEAISRANYVAAQSVQKHGTQTSYPSLAELPESLFKQ